MSATPLRGCEDCLFQTLCNDVNCKRSETMQGLVRINKQNGGRCPGKYVCFTCYRTIAPIEPQTASKRFP